MSGETEDDLRADFLVEAGELVQKLGEQLVALEQHPSDQELLNAVFRGFHTVKGGAGFLGLDAMVDLCHAAEDVFNGLRNGRLRMQPQLMDAVLESVDHLQAMMAAVSAGEAPARAPQALIGRLHAAAQPAAAPVQEAAPAPAVPAAPVSATISDDEFEALLDELHGAGQAPQGAAPAAGADDGAPAPPPRPAPVAPVEPAESSVRVDTQSLDRLMNLVGELVLVRNRLKTLCGRSEQSPYFRSVGELDHITRGLQSAVMRVRMQPVRKVFARFPRLAREVARSLGKQVEVELSGEDTGLDKSLVEALADPLVHLVRNSVDHGIEPPRQREAAGKRASGRLLLAARQVGDHIVVSVSDDGGGMDPEKLRRKAVEKGLYAPADAARLSVDECLQLVFLPGFSTKEAISEISGRGVGMDVVKSTIVGLGGSVHIASEPGLGTEVSIRLPLTLAILPALMVRVGARLLAMPVAPVLDVFALERERMRRLGRWDVVLYRKDTLRLIHVDRWLGVALAPDEPCHVAVAQAGGESFGFVVSQVLGREEVVVKSIGPALSGLAGVAGATVTGEGKVALIVDLLGLARAYAGSE
ncbi:MAG: chemotaxis protein CheA [Nevskia sp.]|nr:chemotaxis protein CheA [Nevskia sp.]